MGADSHMIRVQPNSARQQQHVAFACFRSSNAAPCALASPLPVYVDEGVPGWQGFAVHSMGFPLASIGFVWFCYVLLGLKIHAVSGLQ